MMKNFIQTVTMVIIIIMERTICIMILKEVVNVGKIKKGKPKIMIYLAN